MDDLSKYHDPDWIDAHLLDRLSESEKKEFEAALQNDSQLREKVEESEVLKKGIEASGREELKKRLRTVEGQVPKEEKTKKRTTLWWAGRIAAAILILIIPVYFIVLSFQGFDSEEVFANNFQPYPVLENGTVRGEAEETALTKGLRAYQNGNYEEAISKLENHVKQAEDSNFGNFYLALSLLANENPAKAIPIFKELSEDDDFKMKEQAKWYLGLALLKNDQPDEARDVFQSLHETAEDSAIRLKAESVLNEM